ncbi:MAG: serine/threonine protein kinase [Euzebya sp.]
MSSEVDPGIPGVEGAVEVGRGGFAIVYKGVQAEFRRTVAAKVLTVELDQRSKLRFERECQALGSLSDHPGIVTVYSAGYTATGRPYLLMPFLSGGSYDDELTQRGALPWREVTDLGIRMADALAAAHGEGILHRDLKPANILRSRHGIPVMADFGIARVAGSRNTSTDAGTLTGSMHYMAPELIDGQDPSVATDIYALGMTLYTLMAGRPAFESDSDHSIVPTIHRILTKPAQPLLGVPEAVNAIVAKAMAKQPGERYGSPLMLGRALQHAQAVCGEAVTPLAGVTSIPDRNGPDDQGPAEPPSSPATGQTLLTTAFPATPPLPVDQAPVPSPDGPGAAPQPQPGRRAALLAVAVVLILITVAVVGVLIWSGGGPGYDLANARPELLDGVVLDDTISGDLGDTPVDGDVAVGTAQAYTVQGVAGDFIRVRGIAQSADLDPELRLLAPDGDELLSDDDGGEGEFGHDSQLDWIFEEDGTYAVVINAFSADGSGPYRLSMQTMTPQAVDGVVSDDIEPHGAAVYSVDAMADQPLSVDLRSEDFDALLTVLSPTGEVLTDDDGGGGTDSRIATDSALAGRYLLIVGATSQDASGSFTLEVFGG